MLRTSTAGGVSAEHATERHLFLDSSRLPGSALVAPELEKWVASQLAVKAAILKEHDLCDSVHLSVFFFFL